MFQEILNAGSRGFNIFSGIMKIPMQEGRWRKDLHRNYELFYSHTLNLSPRFYPQGYRRAAYPPRRMFYS